jgi:uncharacterized protein (DUF111 family)
VETIHGTLSVKQKLLGGKVLQSAPEYDDCVRLANETGVSLAEVFRATLEALAMTTHTSPPPAIESVPPQKEDRRG